MINIDGWNRSSEIEVDIKWTKLLAIDNNYNVYYSVGAGKHNWWHNNWMIQSEDIQTNKQTQKKQVNNHDH